MHFKYVGRYSGWYFILAFSVALLIVPDCLSQEKPAIIFDKTLGGINEDALSSVIQTPDGGYLLVGGTAIYQTLDGDDLHGLSDGIVIKLDKDGHQLWQKNYGGTSDDGFGKIIEAIDGGYLLAGSSKSDPGTGNKTSPLHTPEDFWIVKIDDEGNKIWEWSYGEGSLNMFQDIIITKDGNYMMAGTSRDNGPQNTGKLYDDYWIVKIDPAGNKLWSKTFGGNSLEFLMCIKETADGGFVLGGTSQSDISGDKSEGNFGIYRHDDYWIVKVDNKGEVEWDRTLGGEAADVASAIEEVSDGFLVGGSSNSTPSGNKTTELINSSRIDLPSDLWFIKLDIKGNTLWQKRIGGDDFDVLRKIKKSHDGNFTLIGWSWSDKSYEKTSYGKGKSDMWIVKINDEAEVLWDVTLGGDGDDYANDALILSDSLFLVVGYSNSNASGDKSENNMGPQWGYRDGWVVKFGIENMYCPKVELGRDTTLCKGELLELMVDEGALSYSWNGDNTQSTRKFLGDEPGSYSVEVSFEDCIVSDSIDVQYTSQFCDATIPNVITPNGDDLNEYFVINLPDRWYVNIFNRYGESLYESFDYKNDWNGVDVPTGVYYYRVVNENKSREFKGWVRVIK